MNRIGLQKSISLSQVCQWSVVSWPWRMRKAASYHDSWSLDPSLARHILWHGQNLGPCWGWSQKEDPLVTPCNITNRWMNTGPIKCFEWCVNDIIWWLVVTLKVMLVLPCPCLQYFGLKLFKIFYVSLSGSQDFKCFLHLSLHSLPHSVFWGHCSPTLDTFAPLTEYQPKNGSQRDIK